MGREDETALVEQYMYLVQQIAKKRFSSRLPDDDLMQSGAIGLWEASQKWDRKCEFASYARICIYHNMLDYVRGLGAKKRTEWDELQDADEYTLECFNALDLMELCDDINKAWPRDSIENKVLTALAVGAEKRDLTARFGLNGRQLNRLAKRAWRGVLRAREGQRISTG